LAKLPLFSVAAEPRSGWCAAAGLPARGPWPKCSRFRWPGSQDRGRPAGSAEGAYPIEVGYNRHLDLGVRWSASVRVGPHPADRERRPRL